MAVRCTASRTRMRTSSATRPSLTTHPPTSDPGPRCSRSSRKRSARADTRPVLSLTQYVKPEDDTVNTRSHWLIDKSEAVSRSGMVTAKHPLAAEVGADILAKGGNAIDAAIATAFAVGVVEPFMSGLGGIAFLVYRDARTGTTMCLDGSSVLPAAIRPQMFELLAPDQRSGMYMWRSTKNGAN